MINMKKSNNKNFNPYSYFLSLTIKNYTNFLV